MCIDSVMNIKLGKTGTRTQDADHLLWCSRDIFQKVCLMFCQKVYFSVTVKKVDVTAE